MTFRVVEKVPPLRRQLVLTSPGRGDMKVGAMRVAFKAVKAPMVTYVFTTLPPFSAAKPPPPVAVCHQ